ncbi:hypothetical protein DCAR_0101073 [Daucus carota subsp. sativus]|uniref:RNase H type-1 domain-containing protein n=1 Tax=Daucus carota subsp. sativus TaxID=79200 RepID=A0A166G479_DAUCS|nr:hypothetical protein DCAR_0101073 [Daucus carota subsp. sativus]
MEAVEALPRWRVPGRGTVKINVHGCFFAQALPNGNITGIRVVIRNNRGRILRMLSSSLKIQNRRVNEYYAILEGFLEGVLPDHVYIVQQLNQRREDINFNMEVNLCDPYANELAVYLADHGARNFKNMPRFMAVHEEDVGLGIVHDAEVIEQAGMEEAEVQEQVQGEEAQGERGL